MADGTAPQHLGVLGATSFVGQSLLGLAVARRHKVTAFSRRSLPAPTPSVTWVQLGKPAELAEPITHWIVLSPIWTLTEHFELMRLSGARVVVALSSTSVITKLHSPSPGEQQKIQHMLDSETNFAKWAESNGIRWYILRPTLIYGKAADRNLSEIARLISRFKCFPLLGMAQGKRQPVYVDDVASASLACMESQPCTQSIYVLSGAEIVTYREMVGRVFNTLCLPPRFISLPVFIFVWVVKLLRLLPRYSDWTPEMVQRMSVDMDFEHIDATRDFDFRPRNFTLKREDLP